MQTKLLITGKARRELDQLSLQCSNILSLSRDSCWEQCEVIISDSGLIEKKEPSTVMTPDQVLLPYECEYSLLPPVMTDYFDRVQTETHMIFTMKHLMHRRLRLFDQYFSIFYGCEKCWWYKHKSFFNPRDLKSILFDQTYTTDNDIVIDEQKALILTWLNEPVLANIDSGENGGADDHDTQVALLQFKRVLNLKLGTIYFYERDYEHAQIMFDQFLSSRIKVNGWNGETEIRMIEEYMNLWLSVVLGLMHRHNLSFQKSFDSFYCALTNDRLWKQFYEQDDNRTGQADDGTGIVEFRKHIAYSIQLIRSGLWYWMGIVCEDLKYMVWAVQCYQACLKFIMKESAIASMEHIFVNIAVVYLRLAENYRSIVDSGIDVNGHRGNSFILHLYTRSYEQYGVENPNLLIQISPFRIQYQQAVIAIRIAKMLYVQEQFQDSVHFLKRAETRLLQIRYIETQGEGSEYAITDYLHDLHRTIAITYCRLGKIAEASRYVKFPVSSSSPDLAPQVGLTYEQQLNAIKQRKKRGTLERKAYARAVVEQEHPISYISLLMIAFIRKDIALSQIVLDAILATRNEPLFSPMPIVIWQHIISHVTMQSNYKQAQLLMSKCLIFHKDYSLGWYVLLLLSVLCNDTTFIIGSYQQLMRLTPGAPIMKFWTYILREMSLLTNHEPHLLSKL